MSGPRYGGRGRSKCRIRIDEGHNRFNRSPTDLSKRAPRAGPMRLEPRPPPRGGHWGLGGQSAEASRPMSWLSLASARRASASPLPQRTPRSPRAARTGRGTGWRSKLTERPLSNFGSRLRLSGSRICAHCETVSGPRRRRWRPMRRSAFRMHAGAGSVDVRGPASVVCCTPVVDHMLLGGGRLGQRLNPTDADWAVAVGAEAECCGCCFGQWQVGAEPKTKQYVRPDRSNPVQTTKPVNQP
jgi:hypothetical protein